jgi:hypothetical protein
MKTNKEKAIHNTTKTTKMISYTNPTIKRILDISVPGHFGTDLDISVLGTGHFGTDLDISVLGTGQFGTWMRQYSVLTTIVWYLLTVNIFVRVVL